VPLLGRSGQIGASAAAAGTATAPATMRNAPALTSGFLSCEPLERN
jgi:hypothetical protein